LVGAAELDGSIYNPDGINPSDLLAYFKREGGIKNYPHAKESFDDERAIYADCDIYIPSYCENQIHKGNVDQFKCKMIAEGANGPITPAAGKALKKMGIYVFPDVLVNAGGHCTSYFEWLKNLDHMQHGRLTKRWEEKSKILLLEVIKKLTGLRVN